MSAVLAAIGLVAVPATAQPSTGAHKIEASVASTLDAKGSTDFYVEFSQRADLGAASQIEDWTQRGQAVVAALKKTANDSQAEVRKQLDDADVAYKPFWISNTILVKGGTQAVADALAQQANVTTLRAPRTYALPTPTAGSVEATVNAVEWGIAAINADDVWPAYGRGEGIVVANVDTGVDFDHPALVGKYRGNLGGGAFDHNYNWADPSSVCGTPSLAPCDNNDHGTHTMGTMVGDDGAGNQVGVAPGARWIAAKGCESNSCSDSALLGSAEWIAEPTDLTGANPRADLRPHIVNNSWGGGGGDRWYADSVNAWRAAGIFPAFSNGNSGSACATSGSPGDYPESYSSGAFDVNGNIASFSSRGAAGSEIKPNLAAPGVNVRSSVDGGGYAAFNGTSMASPHTAGTVALMWSAAPSLVGDIEQTFTLLDDTATDTPNAQCGGSDDDNNVFGEGKLNALMAVEQSPRGPVGTLAGTVTNASTNAPVAGARVVVEGEVDRTGTTNAAGQYTFPLPVGDYTVTVSAFGYGNNSGTVTITEGATTTRDVALSPVPSGSVSGVVTSASGPVANASVTINGTPIPPVTTAANGSYSFASVPNGTYTVTATAGGCFGSVTVDLVVDGAETLNITLPQRSDSFGYSCVIEGPGYVEANTVLPLTGDDAAAAVTLPFAFNYYGTSYNRAFVATNGHLNFGASSTSFSNVAVPSTTTPNAAIYPFWDDFVVTSGTGSIRTETVGAAPNRSFIVEWRNAAFYASRTNLVDFQIQLNEDGSIVTRYRNLNADPIELGNSATVGIENAAGTVGLQYSFNAANLANDKSVKFLPPPSGVVTGTVTDANDGQPVEGATVRALNGTTVVGTTTTAANGTYSLRLLLGTYTIEIGKTNYGTNSGTVTLDTDDQVITRDAALATAAVTVGPDTLSFLGNEGQLRTSTVSVANTSTSGVALTYALTDDASWLWTVPASGTVAPGATRNLTVRVDASGLEPGVHRGTINITTNAGRTPTVEIPVTLVVPAYRQGVDAGSTAAFTDGAGDPWGRDQAWTPGGYGYLGAGYVNSSRQDIAGTDNDGLYQTQREATSGYRFDNLPAGTYVVDLEFAELRRNLDAGRRVFDVSINGQLVMLRYDPVAAVGTMAADHREFQVTVPEGGAIAIDFGAIRGQLPPTVNGVRVTHRPDLG
ncbi:MAG TPA: carboxypeptidase regulatory-like domain-containing protein [Pseudonocardiaceae bacterium]